MADGETKSERATSRGAWLAAIAVQGLVAACGGTTAPGPSTVDVASSGTAKPDDTAEAAPADAHAVRHVAKAQDQDGASDRACCAGKNECKGLGNCKVEGAQDCKGKNDCKGRGGCKSTECNGEAPVQKACCKGLNDCKGKGMCKTNQNACKGLNACKGQGGCKPSSC